MQIAPSEELSALCLPELHARASQSSVLSSSSTKASSQLAISTCFLLKTQGSWCIQIYETSCIFCYVDGKCPI